MTKFTVFFVAITFAAPAIAEQQTDERPNVILIYTDDQGSVNMNAYGAEDLYTPHMDSLAEHGVRFTQFYSAAPVCSPSRAALLTGRYPQRAGLATNTSSTRGQPGMPTEQVTLAEMFRATGYATGHIGKWHVGYSDDTMPHGQGFDYSFGHMGGCIDNYSHFFYWQGPNRHDLWQNEREVWCDGEFFPDLMVEQAGEFMKKVGDRPFFLYWASNLPHYPLQGADKWRKHYSDLPIERARYAAFVSTVDESIGRLLAGLDERGQRNNTIIIFQSDHGHSTEERTFGGGGSAGPYRGAKFSLFEGGIRVPAIICGPGIPEGEVRTQLATACDWMPTLAELCEIKRPDRTIDGKSLVPVIRKADAPTPHDEFHWQSGRSKSGPQWAVRSGDWKLIGNPRDTSNKGRLGKDDQLFLVNLADDVTEMTNTAQDHPDVVQRLKGMHDRWITEVANDKAQSRSSPRLGETVAQRAGR